MTGTTRTYGLIGIGIGVFNLSLAALLEDNGYRDAVFFDRQPEMTWHGGLLLESSELQVHYLKDLVTPVDPTSRFSFLNYLAQRGVLYQFLNRRGGAVGRGQFQRYFRWVADALPSTRFGSTVEAVEFDGEHFRVRVNGEEHRSRHLAVATGPRPTVPDCARPHLGDRVFHASEYRQRREGLHGARITVVGGGQTGAEVVLDAMNTVPHRELAWYGRRLAFSQLEDHSFVNELYVPSFTREFRAAAEDKRLELLDRLAMSSDGITQHVVDAIYRLAYDRMFFSDNEYDYDFRAGQELVGLEPAPGGGYELTMRSWLDDGLRTETTDAVVLATGFTPSSWDHLRGVLGGIDATEKHDSAGHDSAAHDCAGHDCAAAGNVKDEVPPVGQNFEVLWRHQETNSIFVQNGSRKCIGLADPNLSIAAWRAAMIANRVLGREVYSTHPDTPLVRFS
ncbi:SidA/IucD/PvdA family monooxygenase [Actinosynnema sp. NPDC047251]|uniref:L-lysine N6-monooxygenase MbtG n=1 Tax=Saccharothrix espanaensis (strain ATCC 51144 / DSM 44229 / JCM 9112 / NBRC 15066 / NRRL 15764) TaxID=1179773 RepID=K0JX00_SACES|nr:SidA/IucD/PvdA family monooxygenase [Saccharothrix espanaensis]CCH32400.1 L-lysine 6-monooxygenase [Saccharothrix espanaensis DSM 44229]